MFENKNVVRLMRLLGYLLLSAAVVGIILVFIGKINKSYEQRKRVGLWEVISESDLGIPRDIFERHDWRVRIDELSQEQNHYQSGRLTKIVGPALSCNSRVAADEIGEKIDANSKLRWLTVGDVGVGNYDWVSEQDDLMLLILMGKNNHIFDCRILSGLTNLRYVLFISCIPDPAGFSKLQLPELRLIHFSGNAPTDRYVPRRNQFPKLKGFISPTVTDVGIERLATEFPDLEYLQISRADGVTRKSLRWLARFKKLRFLHVGRTTLESQLFDSKSNCAPQLQRNTPSDCWIGYGS